ncbi:transposase [Bacillus sp. Sa1BUA2]|uniref:Transposase n=1 Tax=Bacillus norwichensis TaxID=2762217 RepID=A0ABR8VNM0_9BACI|nr:transposase [Bacillus norwichensis]
MLKVILYAYSQKIYSCREIEQRKSSIMWLVAIQQLDFRTINDFRSDLMNAPPLKMDILHWKTTFWMVSGWGLLAISILLYGKNPASVLKRNKKRR